MPTYEFQCDRHGTFDITRPMAESATTALCPECSNPGKRIFHIPSFRVKNIPRLQFGSGSPGKIISHKETGGLDIFIPSMGIMEQEEVDYIGEVAKDKEQIRVKKAQNHGPRNMNQAKIKAYTDLAMSAPKGQRIKVLREAIKDTGDKLVKGD